MHGMSHPSGINGHSQSDILMQAASQLAGQTASTSLIMDRFLSSGEPISSPTFEGKKMSVQRKLAKMLAPLLSKKPPTPMASPRAAPPPILSLISPPSARSVASAVPVPMRGSSSVDKLLGSMDMSEDSRSKKTSADSHMSSGSTTHHAHAHAHDHGMCHDKTGVHIVHVVASSRAAVQPVSLNAPSRTGVPSYVPDPVVGAPAHITPELYRLLRAAKHCVLPPSPRAEPPTGAPGNTPNFTTPLSMSFTLPSSMVRPHWCLDDYSVLEKLYTGYASTVYKAECKLSGKIVVLKIYTLDRVCDLYKYQIYREVLVHSRQKHEHIVTLHACFQEGDHIVMVQEYADGSDLFKLLHKYGGRLSERLAVQVVLDPFLRVLHYLHSRAIIHRDIKPENILFSRNMTLKLADFGLAIDLREERAVTRAGTLDYMAPEVLCCPFKSRPMENKEESSLYYGARVDAWAVGVLTFELLVGFPPFYDQSQTGTEEKIVFHTPDFPPSVRHMSAWVYGFLEGAWDFPWCVNRTTQRDDLRSSPWGRGSQRLSADPGHGTTYTLHLEGTVAGVRRNPSCELARRVIKLCTVWWAQGSCSG